MKFKIKLETEFGWGEKRSYEICTLGRRSVDASEEGLVNRPGFTGDL